MRILTAIAAISVIVILALLLVGRAGTPAAQRLSGVHVQVTSVQEVPGTAKMKRLVLGVEVSSDRDIDECLTFALDEPFAQRLFTVPATTTGCLRPRAASLDATITFDRLDDIDAMVPAHKLVWGVTGGKCGLILPLFGVCSVDTAGTVDLNLPVTPQFPTVGPIGTFAPFPTFEMP